MLTTDSWSAKEAIIKAYSPRRRLYMRDIEIHQDQTDGSPLAIVLDETRAQLDDHDASLRSRCQVHNEEENATSTSRTETFVNRDESDGESYGETLFDHSARKTLPVPSDTHGELVRISISHEEEYCVAVAIVPVEV